MSPLPCIRSTVNSKPVASPRPVSVHLSKSITLPFHYALPLPHASSSKCVATSAMNRHFWHVMISCCRGSSRREATRGSMNADSSYSSEGRNRDYSIVPEQVQDEWMSGVSNLNDFDNAKPLSLEDLDNSAPMSHVGDASSCHSYDKSCESVPEGWMDEWQSFAGSKGRSKFGQGVNEVKSSGTSLMSSIREGLRDASDSLKDTAGSVVAASSRSASVVKDTLTPTSYSPSHGINRFPYVDLDKMSPRSLWASGADQGGQSLDSGSARIDSGGRNDLDVMRDEISNARRCRSIEDLGPDEDISSM